VSEASREALASVPHATRWAGLFVAERPITPAAFRRSAAPHTVRYAVEGLAAACVPDVDGRLRGLLQATVDEVTALVRRVAVEAAQVEGDGWAAACALTGVTSAR